MDRLEQGAGKLAQGLALIGSAGILLMLAHVGLDVLTRNLVGRPIPATNEIVSGYYMVLVAFLPLAWVERRGGMVSVEFIDFLLSAETKRRSDIFVCFYAALVYGVLAWVCWTTAMRAFRSGSFVETLGLAVPIWPSYFLLPLGFILAAGITALKGYILLTRPMGHGERK